MNNFLMIFFFSFFSKFRSKKNKRSKSRERRHRRSRSRSRSRSSSSERRRHRREERHEREREAREKEMERERLREIALEFKQSGAFSSIAQQSQSFQQPMQEQTFSAFSSYSMSKPKEMSQAYLEAVAASQRIAASKSFTEMFRCSNSNDSNSNNAFNYEDTNSSKFEIGHKFYLVYDVY